MQKDGGYLLSFQSTQVWMQENSKNWVFSLPLGAKFTWVPFIPILPSARCPVQLGATFTLVFPSAWCHDQLTANFTWVLLQPDAPFSSVPRPPRCNIHSNAPFSLVPRPASCKFHLGVPSTRCSLQLGAPSSSMHGHPDDPFRSVPRLARFNLHSCAPFSSMTHPARCAVLLGVPSSRSSLQFGFPFKSVPCSAAQFSHHYSRSFDSHT